MFVVDQWYRCKNQETERHEGDVLSPVHASDSFPSLAQIKRRLSLGPKCHSGQGPREPRDYLPQVKFRYLLSGTMYTQIELSESLRASLRTALRMP